MLKSLVYAGYGISDIQDYLLADLPVGPVIQKPKVGIIKMC